VQDLISPYRVTSGRGFSLARVDPDDTLWFARDDKDRAQDDLKTCAKELTELQDKLYAQDRWSMLLIFQAMDAAGKDSTIKHVMSGVNPQGCQVFSFKQPSREDLSHDFMWRYSKSLPERGRIGIFNRSYYEEVLIVRVHEEILKQQKIPKSRLLVLSSDAYHVAVAKADECVTSVLAFIKETASPRRRRSTCCSDRASSPPAFFSITRWTILPFIQTPATTMG